MAGSTLGTIFISDTLAILTGFLLDLLFGDPAGRIHPVCLIGRMISGMEKLLFKETDPDRRKREKGVLLAVSVITVTVLVTAGVLAVSLFFRGTVRKVVYLILASLLCDSTLAVRDLRKESMAVAAALDVDLISARRALSRIVGRDTQNLDEPSVIRAAVETVAENTTDGVISPMFYLFLGGPVAAMAYKAVNTMDSMIGYKNDRYLHFGRAAARLDDVLNYIPARIAALLWIAAAGLCGGDMIGALRIWRRDRRCHESPNSAQTESACAGSLGVCLAGDAYYFGKRKKKPTIGNPVRQIEREDIRRANRMMTAAAVLGLAAGMLLRTGILYAVCR